MKVSIAMATYNGAEYIAAQLQSFIGQTRQPDELIITDDCSADDTGTLVRQFSKVAPFRIEFHRNDRNLGYCGNFNSALMRTTGDVVFLSDQDDVWFPEKIEHMLGVMEQHPEALLAMNDAAFTGPALNEVGLTKLGQIRSAGFSLESFVMGCCCVVRRELLDLCMPIPEEYRAHDDWLVEFADALSGRIVVDKVLQYYRRHSANESQFIANRIAKVSRYQVYLLDVARLLTKETRNRELDKSKQLELVSAGIRSALDKAREDQFLRLEEFQLRTDKRIQILKKRMSVREKWILPRINGVLVMLAKGEYRQSSRLVSALRDIVG